MAMLSTRQSPKLIYALKVAAAKSGKSMSGIIREALEASLRIAKKNGAAAANCGKKGKVSA